MDCLPESGDDTARIRRRYDEAYMSDPHAGIQSEGALAARLGERAGVELDQPFDFSQSGHELVARSLIARLSTADQISLPGSWFFPLSAKAAA